jgi:hypothetical protein
MTAISHFDTDDLIMSATSYYLGRRTGMVYVHCQCLIKAWPELSQPVKDYVKRIVECEFDREEILTRNELHFDLFGDTCDRESWCRVRELWKGER